MLEVGCLRARRQSAWYEAALQVHPGDQGQHVATFLPGAGDRAIDKGAGDFLQRQCSGATPLIASALRWAIDPNFHPISSMTWSRSSATSPANLPSLLSSPSRAAAFRLLDADGSGYSSHQARSLSQT
jgi:hypothetical protein